MKVIYVAGPFRSTNPDGQQNHWNIQQNVMRAMELALEVWKAGHVAICPHANTMFYQNSAPDDVWLKGDLELVKRSDAVLLVNNWQSSIGTQGEVELARKLGLPILHNRAELARYLEDGRR